MTEIVILYVSLIWYILENLALKSFCHEPLKDTIGAMGVLASRIILRIHCRLSSKYLAMENVAKVAAEYLDLKTEPKADSSSSSSILLLIKKKTREVVAREDTIKAYFLWPWAKVILKVEQFYLYRLANLLSLKLLEF